jgi:tRNA nucleotidyltransferase (CCA-adding enzyme)
MPKNKEMQCFLVGGSFRDQMLNIPIRDRDWVVVGATPEQLLELGFRQVGRDFPVFLHPQNKEEYALARTERKSGSGYHGFICDFSANVSLEEDLLRRDLTINAMAQDENGHIVDPFLGQQDIRKRLLRHVSPAFIEDPLRVLRVARFAARFAYLGFTIADETMQLLQTLSKNNELLSLSAERVWQEIQRALSERNPEIFFQTLRDCGALVKLMPELDVLFEIPKPEKRAPSISFGEHALRSLRQAKSLNNSEPVSFAALVHHLNNTINDAPSSLRPHEHPANDMTPIEQLCSRLKTPTHYKNLALTASELHTNINQVFELSAPSILQIFKRCDAFRQTELFNNVLICCLADLRGQAGCEQKAYPQAEFLRAILEQTNKVDIAKLQKQGFTGRKLGEAIDDMRCQNISKAKQRLLDA